MKEIANDKLIQIFEFIIQQFSMDLESVSLIKKYCFLFNCENWMIIYNLIKLRISELKKIDNYVYETKKSKLNTLKQVII